MQINTTTESGGTWESGRILSLLPNHGHTRESTTRNATYSENDLKVSEQKFHS